MTPLQTWTSTVAFWSTMAQAPSRVARAQTAATLRIMRAASPWKSARRAAPAEQPASEVTPAAVPTLGPALVVAVEMVPVEAPQPAEMGPVPAESVPQEALIHASPAAIAAATAIEVEALPVEEPEPAPVAAEEPEAPALAVLAEPESPASSLPHLDLLPDPIQIDAAEPAPVATATLAQHSARARKPSGGARSRKPGRV